MAANARKRSFSVITVAKGDSLTRSLIRARVVHTFVQDISSKIFQEKSYL